MDDAELADQIIGIWRLNNRIDLDLVGGDSGGRS